MADRERDGHWSQYFTDEDNCCFQCLGCLARVPCATFTAWLFLVVSVAACTASLIIGTDKTRTLLEQDDNFLGKMMTISICVLFGMVFFCTLFLLLSLVSTGRTSKQIFDSMKKNYCARAINVASIVVMVILQLLWIVITCLLFIPILFFLIVHHLYKVQEVECVNLKHYGITTEDKTFCEDDLRHMYNKSEEPMICFGIAYFAAIIAAICMTFFMMFSTANIVYLKEGRFATYNVYRNGMQNNPGGPVTYVDTKM